MSFFFKVRLLLLCFALGWQWAHCITLPLVYVSFSTAKPWSVKKGPLDNVIKSYGSFLLPSVLKKTKGPYTCSNSHIFQGILLRSLAPECEQLENDCSTLQFALPEENLTHSRCSKHIWWNAVRILTTYFKKIQHENICWDLGPRIVCYYTDVIKNIH